MKHKRLFVYGFVVIVSLLLTSVLFSLYGPVTFSLDGHKIIQITFREFGEPAIIYIVNEEEKETVLDELSKIKFSRTPNKCKCRGYVEMEIFYIDNSKVNFDGFYLNKTNIKGKTKSIAIRDVSSLVSEIYVNHAE